MLSQMQGSLCPELNGRGMGVRGHVSPSKPPLPDTPSSYLVSVGIEMICL